MKQIVACLFLAVLLAACTSRFEGPEPTGDPKTDSHAFIDYYIDSYLQINDVDDANEFVPEFRITTQKFKQKYEKAGEQKRRLFEKYSVEYVENHPKRAAMEKKTAELQNIPEIRDMKL